MNNYQITESTKKAVLQDLIDLSSVVAAIPNQILDKEMQIKVLGLLQSAQESSRMLENARLIGLPDLGEEFWEDYEAKHNWVDNESDVQN